MPRLSRSTPPDSTSFSSRLRRSRPSQPHVLRHDWAHAAAELHAARIGDVAGNLGRIELDAPRLQQLDELRRRPAGAASWPSGPPRVASRPRDRRTPAPCRRRARTGRWRRPPRRVSRSGCATISTSMSAGISLASWRQRLDLEEIADLLHHHLRRLLPPAAHHRPSGSWPPSSGRPVISPTTRFFGLASVIDQLGQVVLEERARGRSRRTGCWRRCRWSWCRRGRSSRSRLPWLRRTPRRPAATALSSASENGSGSKTSTCSLPPRDVAVLLAAGRARARSSGRRPAPPRRASWRSRAAR